MLEEPLYGAEPPDGLTKSPIATNGGSKVVPRD